MLWILSIKQCHLLGPRAQAISLIAPALWNEILSEIQVTPILMVFPKALKTWLVFWVLRRAKSDGLLDLECVVWMADVFWNIFYTTFCILLFILNL